jgi:tRNA-dihydrouridine synthase B
LLCKRLGAGMAATEMTTSDARLWKTTKSRRRMAHAGEPAPIVVQIAGGVPERMVEAARHNVEQGAQIIDINMGCPAKKVCGAAAGSALLRDEELVEQILRATVAAVAVPVTLKIRTGWDRSARNALRIARIAQDLGIAALAIHGRARNDFYEGQAEYDTIAEVKQALSIPVIANGDITTPEQAAAVLRHTGADAVMIGRAAQGRPWIFAEISHYLQHGQLRPAPTDEQIRSWLLEHLQALHEFYGADDGVRIARKHLGWYAKEHPQARAFRDAVNAASAPQQQIDAVWQYFSSASEGCTA